MNKGNVILKNSLTGLISQVSTILFNFITRSLFIKYIGVELLGINSTFASVLGTLALAEMGFQTAITYNLYRPLHDGDHKSTNDVMNIFKLVYRCIGFFFIAASVLVLPFLKYILTGIDLNRNIYIYFLLQAAASSCTYFLAYKRAIFYADQKDYISKIVDLVVGLISNILQCVCLAILKSYVLYLLLKIVQNIASNLIVHVYCRRIYPYLRADKIEKAKLKTILGNVKNVFAGKIAGYIYSSTDNLVVSAFVSTTSVGYLVNYTTITKSLRTLCTSILNPIIPIIGNHLVDEQRQNERCAVFTLYTHIRYQIAVFVIIPTVVLIDDFVSLWVGSNMILPRTIVVLLAADFFIDIVHSATADYINGAGLFKAERNIEIAGALTNIVTSVILVHFAGISGVLIGTVISQMVFWIGRSYVVFFNCLRVEKKYYAKYWMRNAVYVVLFVVACRLCMALYAMLPAWNGLLRVLAGGVICEVFLLAFVAIAYCKLPEQLKIVEIVKSRINGRCRKA